MQRTLTAVLTNAVIEAAFGKGQFPVGPLVQCKDYVLLYCDSNDWLLNLALSQWLYLGRRLLQMVQSPKLCKYWRC